MSRKQELRDALTAHLEKAFPRELDDVHAVAVDGYLAGNLGFALDPPEARMLSRAGRLCPKLAPLPFPLVLGLVLDHAQTRPHVDVAQVGVGGAELAELAGKANP